MATEVEYVNYKDFVAGLESTESPDVDDVTVVSNSSDGPRTIPANTSALSNTATDSDLTAAASFELQTPTGKKKAPANLLAKASEQTALTTYAQNVAHSIAPEYNGTTGAVAGRLYMNEGTEYLCIKDTSGTFDTSCFVNKIMLDGTTFANGQLIADKSKDYGWTDGLCDSADGSITSSTAFQYNSNLIPVLPGGTYLLGHRENAERVYFYDSEQNFISASSRYGTVDSITFTVPNNCYFVRYSFRNQTGFTSGSVLKWSGPFSSEFIQKIDIFLKGFAVDTNEKIEGLSKYFVKISTTFEDGKFVCYSNGALLNFSGYSASDYIEISDASVVNINKAITTAADYRGAAFYDSAKNYISGYQYAVNTPDVYIDVPANAKYIRFTAKTSELTSTEIRKVDVFGTIDKVYAKIDKVYAKINSLVDSLNVAIGDYIDGKFINYANGNVTAIAGCSVTDFIEIDAASKLRLIATSVSVADARGAAFYSSSKGYISGYQYTGVNVDVELSVPSGARYIRFTTKTSETSSTRLYLYDIYGFLKKTGSRLNELEADGNVLAAFNNIICIGDSLTDSQVWTGAATVRQAYRTYPQILGKLCGTDSVTAYAQSGDTTIANWTRYNSQVSPQTNALAIIYLGTNGGLTDTLDEDAPADADPSTWADTNTGCYAKWVDKLLSLGYKVLLIKPFGTSSQTTALTKEVVGKIGARFGAAVLESFRSADDKYHYYPDLSGTNGVHYNGLGYAWFASNLIHQVSKLPTDQMKLIIPA